MIPLKDDVPTKTYPIVIISIILLNSLIFAYQLFLGSEGERIVYVFGAIPSELNMGLDIFHLENYLPVIITIFTSMFIHFSP